MSVRSFFGDIARPQQGESVIYQKGGLVTSIKAMKIKGPLGEDSEVLASDGVGGIEWRALESGGGGLVQSLAGVMGVGGTAGADLDMGEFDIIKSSQLGIDAPSISLSGTVSFTDIPLCPAATDATQSEQLGSKGYVDGAISQVVISSGGVSVDIDNKWQVPQTFAYGINAAIEGVSYNSAATDSVSYGHAGDTPGTISTQNPYWLFNGTKGSTWALPNADPSLNGVGLTIFNDCDDSSTGNLTVMSNAILNFCLNQSSVIHTSVTWEKSGAMHFVCLQTATAGWAWCVDNYSGNVSVSFN